MDVSSRASKFSDSLSRSYNAIGDAGATSIAVALPGLARLIHLNLRCVARSAPIRGSGARAVGQSQWVLRGCFWGAGGVPKNVRAGGAAEKISHFSSDDLTHVSLSPDGDDLTSPRQV